MSSVEWIKATYEQARQTPSDIHEHLPTLFELSKECQDIAELGVRRLVSTWAFLNGLLENTSPIKNIHCVDLEPIPHADIIIHNVGLAGIQMKAYQEDSAKVILPPVDLLFIDTFHVYGHLKRELEHHHASVRKYIAMHDTVVDGVHGEAVRSNFNILDIWQKTGYPVEELTKGLTQAIQEFLVAHPEWKIQKHYMNNNGLTILKRT